MKDDRPYLLHIREAITNIQTYTSAGREDFMARKIVQDAVIRNLEIIGKATKLLSTATKASRPGTPWKEISGMRDVLIHHYFGVQLSTVWDVVEVRLKPLSEAIEFLLTDGED